MATSFSGFSTLTPTMLFNAFGAGPSTGAFQGLGNATFGGFTGLNSFGGFNGLNAVGGLVGLSPAFGGFNVFNPMDSLVNNALAPTMSSLTGVSMYGGEQPFGPNWMSSVINSAHFISSGAVDGFTSGLVPQNGFTGVSALGGSNKIAIKYMLDMLAKKDPESPETDKFAEKIMTMAGGSPEAMQMVAQQRLNSFDGQIAQLVNIRAGFANGTPDAIALDAKIQMMQAKRNNVIINFNIDQILPANGNDLRIKFLRDTLMQLSSVNPASPEAQQLIQRVVSLGGNSPLIGQLINLATDRAQNNAVIAEYTARFNPPPPQNPLAAFGDNPLGALFGMLFGMLQQTGVPADGSAQ